MDKNAIKRYATWARVELIARVSQKAEQLGVTRKHPGNPMDQSVHGHLLSAAEQVQRAALIAKVNANGWQHTMEEVAYTWFNRFCALRYMEVNGYLPSHIRVFSDEAGAFAPQILAETIHVPLPGLDMEKVYQFKEKNQTEALYKYLLITQCNALSVLLPQMFQRIEDFTELLMPDNLLREGSVVEQMVTQIPEEDWTDQVQIIGWLYQYYNAEPKDKVFDNLKKNIKISKHDIPAATQLFTPDWIVRYMVENSLGRLWLERERAIHLGIDEKATAEGFGWKYYLEEAEQEPEVAKELASIRAKHKDLKPEDIRCIDPCMGSGHILVYMFDVLMQIYLAYGYSPRDAVRSILTHNLYGLDIDDRAAQLAYFAVMMKARQYDRRLLSRTHDDGRPDIPQPNVFPIMESNGLSAEMVAFFVGGDAGRKAAMDTLMREMKDAKEYGSILTISSIDFNALYTRFDEVVDEVHFQRDAVLNTLLPFVRQAQALARQYDVVVTNPPYMGSSGMGRKLSTFVKTNYPISSSDMSTVFMERTLSMLTSHGNMSMINIPVWMFLSTYGGFRDKLLNDYTIINMVHPGRGIFGSDFGTTAFAASRKYLNNYKATYYRLYDSQGEVEGVEEREKAFLSRKGHSVAVQDNYSNIPGTPIAYWVSDALLEVFRNEELMDTFAPPKQGSTLGINDQFLRFWYETDNRKLCTKWYPCVKGGEFRKWYGNHLYLVDWENNGARVKSTGRATIRNSNWLFKPGIHWSRITISQNSFRILEKGFFFESAAGVCFPQLLDVYFTLGLLNSSVIKAITSAINPTLTLQSGDVACIPVRVENKELIEEMVKVNIDLSKDDWDSFETSWDFKVHPAVQIALTQAHWNADDTTVAECFHHWKQSANERYEKQKANEKELNHIFIEIYGLQDELTPEVEDKDVTVYRIIDEPNEDKRRMRYVLNKKDAIITLISYAVGCILGRYSLDSEGLAYAGGAWDDGKYSSFLPDRDGILPITDSEYFTDDIVTRFVDWVRVAYGQDTLEENLCFVADSLGGSGTSREVIRNYFLKDFYKDHVKTYKKRPIYWLFDSGPQDGFKALIYLHRYAPDTIARIRTDYVHELQSRYRTAMASLSDRIASATTAERVKLNKQLAKITAQAEELRLYEEKIHHLADQMISIDLDDGVKHNYTLFQDVLAKI